MRHNNHFLYSAEQEKVLKSSHTLANIGYDTHHAALHTIMLRVVRHLKEKKSSLIVIKEEGQKSALIALFQSVGLGHLILDCSLLSHLSEQDYEYIQIKVNKAAPEPLCQDQDADYYYPHYNQSILKAFDLKYGNETHNSPFRAQMDEYLTLGSDPRVKLLQVEMSHQPIHFGGEEAELISQDISAALKLYQKDFELFNNQSMSTDINTSCLVSAQLSNTLEQLTYLQATAKDLTDRYYDLHISISDQYDRTHKDWINGMKLSIGLIIHQLQRFYHTKSKVEAQKSLWNPLRGEMKKLSHEEVVLMKEVDSIQVQLALKNVIQKVSAELSRPDAILRLQSYLEVLDKYTLETSDNGFIFLKSVNTLNHDHPELQVLEAKLRSLTKKINESNIFSQVFELNTLSFVKQKEYVDRLTADINLIIQKMQSHISYYQWSVFLDQRSPKSKSIINILKRFDLADWNRIYDAWSRFETLRQKLSDEIDIDESLLDRTTSYYHQAQLNIVDEINEQYDQLKQIGISHEKNQNSDLYRKLIHNKSLKGKFLWEDLYADYSELMTSLFPICITSNDRWTRVTSGIFNHLYYVDVPDANVEVLQNFDSVFSFFSFQMHTSDVHYSLHQGIPWAIKDLNRVSISERLPIARALSEAMMSFGSEPVIYQMRNGGIISFSTKYVNDYLEKAFYSKGIKRIINEDTTAQKLIGLLLDDESKFYIILDDYLCNVADYSHWMWHRNVAHMLADAGCKVLNVDTKTLLYESENHLQILVNTIKKDLTHRNEHPKKQLAIEFSI
ncbi:MAG: hypothetical protein WAU01_16125 [Saprospiraceae bacterium]